MLESSRDGFQSATVPGGLLANSLKNQDVGIHADTDRQNQSCQTGQGQGETELGQEPEQDQDVDHQPEHGHHAQPTVVDQHEEADGHQTDPASSKTALHGTGPEAWIDPALVHDRDRVFERILEHAGKFLRLGRAHVSAGDFAAAVNGRPDHRRGINLAVQDHR